MVGIEPAIFSASSNMVNNMQLGENGEYDFAGWLKGQPIEVIKGELTGLPIPAFAEIAFEGEILPGKQGGKAPLASGQAMVSPARPVPYGSRGLCTATTPY